MEKKVYKIAKWFCNEKCPDLLKVFPRHGYDEEYDAEEEFRHLANSCLHDGCRIVHVVHTWNYTFEAPSGEVFNLYMYED